MAHSVDVYLHPGIGERKHVAIKFQEQVPVVSSNTIMPPDAGQVIEVDRADDGSVVALRIFACDVDRVRWMKGGDPINGVEHEPRNLDNPESPPPTKSEMQRIREVWRRDGYDVLSMSYEYHNNQPSVWGVTEPGHSVDGEMTVVRSWERLRLDFVDVREDAIHGVRETRSVYIEAPYMAYTLAMWEGAGVRSEGGWAEWEKAHPKPNPFEDGLVEFEKHFLSGAEMGS